MRELFEAGSLMDMLWENPLALRVLFAIARGIVRAGEDVSYSTSFRTLRDDLAWRDGRTVRLPGHKPLFAALQFLTEKSLVNTRKSREGTLITLTNEAVSLVNICTKKTRGNAKKNLEGTPPLPLGFPPLINPPLPNPSSPHSGGELKKEYAPFIKLSEKEYQALLEEFGAESLKYHIPACSDWQKYNKPKKDAAAFLRNWIRRAIAERTGFYHKNNQEVIRLKTEVAKPAPRGVQLKHSRVEMGSPFISDVLKTLTKQEAHERRPETLQGGHCGSQEVAAEGREGAGIPPEVDPRILR